MSSILGDYIGFDESKYIEFKEFVLKIDPITYLDIDDIKKIITDGNLCEDFNEVILNNLNHYLKFYLPKYISAFGNVNDKTQNGTIYIGVNDVGEITGIPFIGKLDVSYIESIKDSIKIFIDTQNIDELFSKIIFEIIDLKKNSNYFDDIIDDLLNENEKIINEYKKKYSKFLKDHIKWIDMIDHFSVKTSTFITDKKYRKEVSEYIRKKTNNIEYLKIADHLDGDVEFKILNGIEISEQKNNMNNVYYWLTTYKDELVDQIKSVKPLRPPYIPFNHDDIYIHQFQLLTNLRKRFLENNDNINYYILKINIPTYHTDIINYTKLGSRQKWQSRTRDVQFGTPCCI
jgi:hypothetical protein